MVDSKLSSIIQYKLPQFVQDEHEMFIAFVKAFYEYAEQEGNWLHFMERYQRNLDVDRADDDFLDQYLKEFATTFPKNTMIPSNQLLKLMREFYLSKGSEDSFRFAFTILYNADIEIIYPREFMYVPSSGSYSADLIAYITGDNWFKLNIDNNDLSATIEGNTSGSGAVIDSIISTYIEGQQILQLEISSYNSQFEPGETVTLTVDGTEVLETMLGAITSIEVTDGGSNYKVDDEVNIVDSGSGLRAKANIESLFSGALDQVTVTNPGTGYEVGDTIKAQSITGSNGYGFRASVYEVGGSGEIIRVRIENGGHDYSSKTAGIVSSGGGTGALIELNGDAIGKIKSVEVIDGGINYSSVGNITLDVVSDEGTGAVLTPVLNGVFTSPKRYRDAKSMTSGTSKVLDSYYYQQFSYVIGSKISPHEWFGSIKRILHPAGTQLFGMFKLENEFDISIELAPGFASAIGRNLSFVNSADLLQDLSTSTQQFTRIRYIDANCQMGLTLNDLDQMKFNPNFNWSVGDFANYSIRDVEASCADAINKQESTDITIT